MDGFDQWTTRLAAVLAGDVPAQSRAEALSNLRNTLVTGQPEIDKTRRRILQLIAEGRTNRSAAEFLCVSPKTVEKHRASLMQKLGLRNATEMTLAAIEVGLIERPSSFSRFSLGNTPLDAP